VDARGIVLARLRAWVLQPPPQQPICSGPVLQTKRNRIGWKDRNPMELLPRGPVGPSNGNNRKCFAPDSRRPSPFSDAAFASSCRPGPCWDRRPRPWPIRGSGPAGHPLGPLQSQSPEKPTDRTDRIGFETRPACRLRLNSYVANPRPSLRHPRQSPDQLIASDGTWVRPRSHPAADRSRIASRPKPPAPPPPPPPYPFRLHNGRTPYQGWFAKQPPLRAPA